MRSRKQIGQPVGTVLATQPGLRSQTRLRAWITNDQARDIGLLLLCFFVAVALIHPAVEMGVNDDWSYAYTALQLARTGRLTYNGWATAAIGPQAYWGALFIELFGFSFTIVRLSGLVLGAACVPVLYFLSRAAGLTRLFASFAVLLVVTSPLFLPQATSFMTDVPGLLLFSLCLLASLYAWRAASFRQCAFWAVIAAGAGILAGATRQVFWPAPLWFLLVLIVLKRREPATGSVLVGAWIFTLLAMIGLVGWLNRQPYTLNDFTPLASSLHVLRILRDLRPQALKFADTVLLFSLPILVLYAAVSRQVLRQRVWVAGLVVAIAVAWFVERVPARRPPRLGNTVTEYGSLPPGVDVLGIKPVVLSPAVRDVLGIVMLVCAAACGAVLLHLVRSRRLNRSTVSGLIPFVTLGFPFAAVNLGLISLLVASQVSIFDRYFLPLLPIVAIALLGVFQAAIQNRIPVAGWVTLFIFAAFAVATTHDVFAARRARAQAARELVARGVPRNKITAGVEYDGWTQITLGGHLNDPRIRPASAYRRVTKCTGPSVAQFWFFPETPIVQPRYFVVPSRLRGLVDGPIQPVAYRTWLPPLRQEIYTEMLPDGGSISCH